MKSFTLFSSLFPLAALTSAQTLQRLTYSQIYDNAGDSIDNAACGDQLSSKWPTFGSIPTFPAIGGSYAVGNFASPNCGSCWLLQNQTKDVSVYFTAIDFAAEGFISSEETFFQIGGEAGLQAGSIEVWATQVDESNCN